MIKFEIKKNTNFGRLGEIFEWGNEHKVNIKTPCFMIYTKGGSIPHLQWNNFEDHLKLQQDPIIQINISSFTDSLEALKRYGKGASSFANIPKHLPVHLTGLDHLGKIKKGYNNNSGIAVWTKSGKTLVDSAYYRSFIDAVKPSSFSTLMDYDTPKDASRKKLQKSVIRTNNYMKDFDSQGDIGIPRIVSINGGDCMETRAEIAKVLSVVPSTSGFNIDMTLFSYSEANEYYMGFKNEHIKRLLQETFEILPEKKLKLSEGLFSPTHVLFLVSLGFDIFDSSYASDLAQDGMAFRLDDDYPHSGGSYKIIDFKDRERFEKDYSPITYNCDCYSCKHYTKSYITHLVRTKELLAPLLLTIHNLYEYDKMFHLIRTYIDSQNIC
uniref:TGT domain-containing protein n=1 Tax=Parastrongyloides trichosuri TaxID=131310 RepID=A0A0N4ZRI9_PARTI